MTATEARPLSGVPSAASRVAAEISAEPDAGLLLDITGPGGCGKTPVLEAAARAYAEAEVPVVRSLDGGAGPADGQVLVFHDLLGIYDGHVARFAKRFADVRAHMVAGVAEYSAEVRSRTFPAPEHCYSIDDEQLAAFRAGLT